MGKPHTSKFESYGMCVVCRKPLGKFSIETKVTVPDECEIIQIPPGNFIAAHKECLKKGKVPLSEKPKVHREFG